MVPYQPSDASATNNSCRRSTNIEIARQRRGDTHAKNAFDYDANVADKYCSAANLENGTETTNKSADSANPLDLLSAGVFHHDIRSRDEPTERQLSTQLGATQRGRWTVMPVLDRSAGIRSQSLGAVPQHHDTGRPCCSHSMSTATGVGDSTSRKPKHHAACDASSTSDDSDGHGTHYHFCNMKRAPVLLERHPHGGHAPPGYTCLRPDSLPNVKEEDESLDRFWPRVTWLVVLLIFQSLASVILQGFQGLVVHHPVVIAFLTMLIGSGGNAASQSTVLLVREIATGRCKKSDYCAVLYQQLRVGVAAAGILLVVTFLRTYFFEGDGFEVLAVCLSMFLLVIVSVFIGTVTPMFFKACKIDPAHAGAAIQVIVDIVGITLVCVTSHLILDVIAPRMEAGYLERYSKGFKGS